MAYPKVVIIGGGFGGLSVAKGLCDAKVEILVVDRTNHHVFQPLLYQVASGALSSGNIAAPIREILRHQQNTTVIMANIVSIDTLNKKVTAKNGDSYSYDYLIVAAGASHSYFNHPEWEEVAPGLKTIQDAVRIREKVLLAFELAERSDSISQAIKFLRFVIIGGGPTGVEMAGDIAEIAHRTMFKNFRKIRPEQAEIYLIEGLPQILPSYPKDLAYIAQSDLEKLGVKVLTNTMVTNVTKEGVMLGDKFLESSTIIWAAGNQASPLLKTLNVPLDKQGRVLVQPDLSIPGHPEVFVIGDAALFVDKQGMPLPGIAPVAIQQGRYIAKLIKKRIPPENRSPFKYFDKGMMATIGKAKAVGVIRKLHFSGFLAWLAWCFVHIMYLITYRNRAIVMLQWTFWYLTGRRPVRLITRPIEDDSSSRPVD